MKDTDSYSATESQSRRESARPSEARIEVSALRKIAWHHWDPLCLNDAEDSWRPSDPCDHYDPYLWRVASALENGEPEQSMVNYLVHVEVYHMGKTLGTDTRARARTTVARISEYLNELLGRLDEAA